MLAKTGSIVVAGKTTCYSVETLSDDLRQVVFTAEHTFLTRETTNYTRKLLLAKLKKTSSL